MSRSMKYQKRNHTHFMCSKALGLGVMNKRCVYLQLHDLCAGTAIAGCLNMQQTLFPVPYTLTTALGTQPVQWLLREGLVVEHGSGKKPQLLLLEVKTNCTETSIDYKCVLIAVSYFFQ